MLDTALGCANAKSKPGYICLDERFDRTNPHNVYLVIVTLPSATGNEKMFSESWETIWLKLNSNISSKLSVHQLLNNLIW